MVIQVTKMLNTTVENTVVSPSSLIYLKLQNTNMMECPVIHLISHFWLERAFRFASWARDDAADSLSSGAYTTLLRCRSSCLALDFPKKFRSDALPLPLLATSLSFLALLFAPCLVDLESATSWSFMSWARLRLLLKSYPLFKAKAFLISLDSMTSCLSFSCCSCCLLWYI